MSRLVIWACRVYHNIRRNDGGYRRDAFVRDGEPVTLTGRTMTILPRHKDVAKSRLNLRNRGTILATGFGSGLSPAGAGTMGSLAAIPLLVFDDVSAVAALFTGRDVWDLHWRLSLPSAAKDMGVHDHGSVSGMGPHRYVDSANGVADDGLAVGGCRVRYFPHSG